MTEDLPIFHGIAIIPMGADTSQVIASINENVFSIPVCSNRLAMAAAASLLRQWADTLSSSSSPRVH